nr:MAG TPA: hypothetical protein [Caudoviricetes sp.]
MKKLSSELKTLLEGSIEEWDSYDWNKLTPKQVENCAVFLKATDNFNKLKHLIEILLKTDNKFSVVCIFEKYPELIEQLQLAHIGVLLCVMCDHPRNCKYISDTQWKMISDYSQKYSHLYTQFNKPTMYQDNHSYQHKTQVNYIKNIFQGILLQPQYHEYIAKFIQFNIQIHQLNKVLDEQTIITTQFKQNKDNILNLIKYIKTTKWYKDNLIGDSVGYNIEKCPVDGINAQDLRDLFE